MGLFNFRKKEHVKRNNLESVITGVQKGVGKEDYTPQYNTSEYNTSDDYPEIVKEIHNHFYTAADKLVAEANEYQSKTKVREVKKGKSLADLGFTNAKQAKEAVEIHEKNIFTKEAVEKMNEYRVKYPNYKFITELQVEEICKKYGLVIGDVSRYTGFVPEKNLKEIANFPGLKKEDVLECEVINRRGQVVGYVHINDIINEYLKKKLKEGEEIFVEYNHKGEVNVKGGEDKWGQFAKAKLTKSKGFSICAPVKDMDMEGKTISEGYKVVDLPEIVDPVVLQRVPSGYLILTAWGPEASDPIVVNQINN